MSILMDLINMKAKVKIAALVYILFFTYAFFAGLDMALTSEDETHSTMGWFVVVLAPLFLFRIFCAFKWGCPKLPPNAGFWTKIWWLIRRIAVA